MKSTLWWFGVTICLLLSPALLAQTRTETPLTWSFTHSIPKSADANKITVMLLASIEPGWHLYSQFLQPGGPIPTRFSFAKSPDFALSGTTREQGNGVKFHDDLYEMDILWYPEKVEFTQDILIYHTPAQLHGTVEYMVCNDHICLPRKENFTITIQVEPQTEKKSPQ